MAGTIFLVAPLRVLTSSQQWTQIKNKAAAVIQRAAALQAERERIEVRSEALKIATLYRIDQKPPDWREFWDVALHLTASYPPDLALLLIYLLRETPVLKLDPVPLVLKAIEELHLLRPSHMFIDLDRVPKMAALLFSPPVERGQAAAQILAREISGVPLRHASAIYALVDPTTRSFVDTALRTFNPRAADILRQGSRAWVLTWPGLRLLFRSVAVRLKAPKVVVVAKSAIITAITLVLFASLGMPRKYGWVLAVVLFILNGVALSKSRISTICAECGRKIQKLSEGEGFGILLSKEDAWAGLGAAEECWECGRLFCDLCYPARPRNSCPCGRGRDRVRDRMVGGVRLRQRGSFRLVKVLYL